MVIIGKKRHRMPDSTTTQEQAKVAKCTSSVPSLLDISAMCVASNYPYQEVEEKLGVISGPMQTAIMFHSFPQSEASIELYSSNKLHVNATDTQKQPFNMGVKLVEKDSVSEVVQIGFHLSGVVTEKIGICNRQKTRTFKCSMNFDRNCITSTDCTCDSKSLLWCSHIVALALYRIRNSNSIPLKPPISDSVLDLKQDQLQKLLLLLVSSHRNKILPVVQNLLDGLHVPDSEISSLTGIPDPTAGGSHEDSFTWHMDDEGIRKQITQNLSEGSAGKNIISLINKVREMLSANDRNYVNLLLTITDSVMQESIQRPSIQDCLRTRRIYDELQSLWFCVMKNPGLKRTTKFELESHCNKWFDSTFCPKENIDDAKTKFLLQSISDSIEKDDIFAQSARVEALNLFGKYQAALTSAIQIYDSIINDYQPFEGVQLFNYSAEPITTIFDTLLDNGHKEEALELALVTLSSSSSLPPGEYAQNRLTHRCEQLISRLDSINLKEEKYRKVLHKYGERIYESVSHILDKTEKTIDILPNHCFVRFLFENLIDINSELAFKLTYTLLPINFTKPDNEDDDIDFLPDPLSYNGIFCFIQTHLEYQQGELAASILGKCENYPDYLKLTLTNILEGVKQHQQLLKLAKLCQTKALKIENNAELLGAAFELGVRSIRLTRDECERKACIRWLVSCAVDNGRQAVDFLIRNWTDLFFPKEITSDVAPMLASQPVSFHLKLTTPAKKEELVRNIQNMVIEACIKDPVPCILFALTLCEDNADNFQLACQIVSESNDRFNTAQLFSIARYLETKKHQEKAFKIGISALKKLDVGPADSQHPAVCDVLWICTLASKMGMDQLTQTVPVIENCIHNPLILTEIVERCSNPSLNSNLRKFSHHKEPLNRLVASAQKLFVEDVELKLQNITRKNYSDFSDYLLKIKRAFLLSEDGLEQFQWLIDYIVTSQKGKKKLHQIISKTLISNS